MKMKKAKSTAAILAVMALTAGFSVSAADVDFDNVYADTVTVNSGATINGGANVYGGANVSGTTEVDGDVYVTGGVTSDKITTNNGATLNGGTDIYGGLNVDGGLNADTVAAGTLAGNEVQADTITSQTGETVTIDAENTYLTGNTTVQDSLTVNSGSTLNGGATVNGGLTADTATVNGDFAVDNGTAGFNIGEGYIQSAVGGNSVTVNQEGVSINSGAVVVNKDGATFDTNATFNAGLQTNTISAATGDTITIDAKDTYLTGNTTVQGGLTVNSGATLNGGATVNGGLTADTATVNGDFAVDNGTAGFNIGEGYIQSAVGGNSVTVNQEGVSINSGAVVVNKDGATFDTNATFNAGLQTNTISAATGDTITIDAKDTYLTGNTTVQGGLTVNSGATLNGGATVNGGLTADTVTADTVTATNGNFDLVQGTDAKFTGTVSSGALSVSGDAVIGGNATVGGNLDVGSLTINGSELADVATVDDVKAQIGYDKATNKYAAITATNAEGKTAETLTEAVNTNNSMIHENAVAIQNNTNAINSLDNRVDDLGGEIDQVGAISAALAGLHPLDYDGTGSKFQLSAAMGSYDSTQAAAIGAFYHFNRDVMISLGGATSFDGDHKTAGNLGVTFRVGEGASGKAVSDDVMARLEAMDQKIAALEQENKDLKNVLGAIDTSLSKEFPDVPANHWAYEAVTKLAGNDVVAGYPDGEFHGDRTMTRYEMAEVIYKAMQKGAKVDQKLVNEFKPEMEQVAANQNA